VCYKFFLSVLIRAFSPQISAHGNGDEAIIVNPYPTFEAVNDKEDDAKEETCL